MRYTNTASIPLPLAWRLMHDTYSKGDSDLTVTQVLTPAYQARLGRERDGEIVVDVQDVIYRLLGTLMHDALEQAVKDMKAAPREEVEAFIHSFASSMGVESLADDIDPRYIDEMQAEVRLYMPVLGITFGGKFDLYYRNRRGEYVLADYKLVSEWEYVLGSKEERAQQLNMLRALAIYNGWRVDRIEIVYVWRDWKKTAAAFDPEKPQSQGLRMGLPIWTDNKALTFIEERVAAHLSEVEGPCSSEERWEKKPSFAVMKDGLKRASKVEPSYDEAMAWARWKKLTTAAQFGEVVVEELIKGVSIVERPGENTRCVRFCDVARFCDFGRALLAAPESVEVS